MCYTHTFCCFSFGSPNHAGVWKSKVFHFEGLSIPKYSSFWKNVVLTNFTNNFHYQSIFTKKGPSSNWICVLSRFTAICCKQILGDKKVWKVLDLNSINVEFIESEPSSARVKSLSTRVKFSKKWRKKYILYQNPPTNQINLPQLIRSHKKPLNPPTITLFP